MEKELISVEKRLDGGEVRYYIDEEGREILEEATGCAACKAPDPARGNAAEGLCGNG